MTTAINRKFADLTWHVAHCDRQVKTWRESIDFWKEQGAGHEADVARCRKYFKSYVLKRTWAKQELAQA
jgi:hypothetical protein